MLLQEDPVGFRRKTCELEGVFAGVGCRPLPFFLTSSLNETKATWDSLAEKCLGMKEKSEDSVLFIDFFRKQNWRKCR